MLYLNSIENAEASPTEKKFAICHEDVPSMQNIQELAPSRELLAQWEYKKISWEEFRKQFVEEMRKEYSNDEMSRLRGLTSYILKNDVTLHSPEPNGEQTYRTILEEIINAILKHEGRTDRVINLAREPIEEAQSIENNSQQTATIAKEEIANLVLQKILPEVTSVKKAKDDEIELIKENAELKTRIDQLEEKILNQERTLQAEIGEKDEENSKLKRQITRLKTEIKTQKKNIGELSQDSSEKKREVRLLQAESKDKDREIAKLKDINTHEGIRDIAIEAARNDPEFRDYVSKLDIDEKLPVDLRKWLESLLKQALNIGSNDKKTLVNLIREYTNFEVEYSTESGSFDKSDNYLAHVIRTQGNISLHKNLDERTKMGRTLCCFFAAALLSSKLPKSDHTSKASQNIHPKQHSPQHNHTSNTSTKLIKPNDAEAYYNRGLDYAKKGNHSLAIDEYTKAIELNPNDAKAYYNRGTAYHKKKDYDRAINDYNEAIRLNPNDAKAYYNRGTAYYRNNYYSRAIADLTRAIKLKPDYATAYNNRGNSYYAKGDYNFAIKDYDKAIELNPNRDAAQHARGNRARAQADLDKAKQLQQ